MRVLLTRGHRNAGLWLTRWLGAAGHEVTVADSRALAFGLRSRHAHAYEWLPEPTEAGYSDRLLALVRRLRPDVLFPLDGLVGVGEGRRELQDETAVLAADTSAHRTLLDKLRVYELCGQFGIPHPRVLGTDPQSLTERVRERRDGSPIAVIKPRLDIGGGRGIVFPTRREGLADLWQRLSREFGALVATEYVRGPVHAQYAVQMLFDRDSELIEFFVLQKLRQWPVGSGITAAARSTHDIQLVAQMLPLLQHLRWRGPVEIELKHDAETGSFRVLEINPRFSGTLSFSMLAGVDVAGSMLEASLGRSRPRALQPYFPKDLYYWSPLPWTRSVFSDLRRRSRIRQGLRDLSMPLLRRPVGNPYALNDPSALVGKIGLQVAEGLRKRVSPRVGNLPG